MQEQQPLSAESTTLGSNEKDHSRACDPCRARKIRCVPSDSGTSAAPETCKACSRSKRVCIFSIPSKKRRRKRTDARVAELEKQVNAMVLALKRRSISPLGSSVGSGGQAQEVVTPANDSLSNHDNEFLQPSRSEMNSSDKESPSKAGDFIDRGLVTLQEAFRLLTRFTHELLPHFPIVVLPESSTLQQMRQSKPILLMAILAAAAGTSHPDLNLRLNREIQQLYADRVAMKGERSVELVQSILVTISWFCPPDKFHEMKFYQYLHMAWAMVLDLGLERKSRSLLQTTSEVPETGRNDMASGLMEHRRTLLSCYLMCGMASLSLRRPNMVRFSKWMAESVTALETSPHAAPSDVRLCAWVRLQSIMEQWAQVHGLDDLTNDVSLMESRFQYTSRGFQKQITEWKEQLAPGVLDECLQIFYCVNTAYLYEMAMYVDHEVDEFQPPFVVKRVAGKKNGDRLPPEYVSAVSAVLASTHLLLDTFTQLDINYIQALPLVTYARVMYAAVVLTKLSMSALAEGSPLGALLDLEEMQTATYLEKVLAHLTSAVGPNSNRAALKFWLIIFKLKSWYAQQGAAGDSEFKNEQQIKPGVYMDPEHDSALAARESYAQDSYHLGGNGAINSRVDASASPRRTPIGEAYGSDIATNMVDPWAGKLGGWLSEGNFDNLLEAGMDLDFDLDLDIDFVESGLT